MNNEEQKILKFIYSLIFNIVEVIVVFLIGIFLKIEVNTIIFMMISFIIFKFIFKKTKHYYSLYKCFIWTILVFLSLYLLSDLSLINILLFTAFTAFIVSGKADITDICMWKNENQPSKYQDIMEFIKYHPLDDELFEFENKLKRQDNLMYLVYKYRFKDNLTFSQIEEKLDIPTPRISEMLDKIAFAMRLNCKI